MKYLKYLLGLILLLVIIFFAKGILTPSIYYESEIVVNKPAKEAWAVMSDESNLPKWIDGFKRTEHVSGTENTIGAISNVYIEESGEEIVMQETITNIRQDELMAMTFTMDFMDMEYEMLFDEKDGKTNIKTKSKTIGNGLFAKSLVSFMTGAMKSQEDNNLISLKKLIEENTKDYFPVLEKDSIVEIEQ
jgi:uncharacterized membrane protein